MVRGFLTRIFQFISLLLLMSCSYSNDLLLDAAMGLRVTIIKGSGQTIFPNQASHTPLTVQVTGSDGTPISGIKISFTEESNYGVTLTQPLVETDSDGLAATSMKIPPQNYGAELKIRASVAETLSSALFTVYVNSNEPGTRFAVKTTHNNVETAGEPFQFVVMILNDDGDIAFDRSDVLYLTWEFDAIASWAGTNPSLPTKGFCTFILGVCVLPDSYTLTDATKAPKVWVGDGTGGLIDVFGQEITVKPGPAALIRLADKAGGPSAGAVAQGISGSIFMDIDYPKQTYVAVLTDKAGNYITEASNANWSVTNEQRFDGTPISLISSHWTVNGSAMEFTPQESGKANLTITVPGYAPIVRNYFINPGVPSQLNILTSIADPAINLPALPNLQVYPGVNFSLKVQVSDKYNNPLLKYDGSSVVGDLYAIYYELDPTSVDTGQAVRAGPSGIIIQDPGYGWQPAGYSATVDTYFSRSGLASNPPRFIINDNTDVSPKITIKMTYSSNPLIEFNKTFNISFCPDNLNPKRINLYKGLGANANYFQFQNDYDSTQNVKAGDPTHTLYLGIEDLAGNFYGNVLLDSFQAIGRWSKDWTYSVASGNSVLTYTPTVAGPLTVSELDDPFTLKLVSLANNLNTELNAIIGAATLDHYVLAVNDGINSNNVLSADRTHKVLLFPKDRFENPATQSGNTSLAQQMNRSFYLNYQNVLPTIKGSIPPNIPQALLPISASWDGLSGAFSINNGYKIPNATTNVSISATDITDAAIGTYFYSNTVNPILLAGPVVGLDLQDAPSGTGISVAGSTMIISTDYAKNLYAALVDVYGNPNTNATCTWDYSSLISVPYAVVTNRGCYLTITGTNIGSGNVTVNADSRTTSTTVSIIPGILDHLTLVPSYSTSTIAGTPFTVTVRLEDAANLLRTDINGSYSVSVNVLDSPSTILGKSHSFAGTEGNGTYTITNGQFTLPSFTFYNAATIVPPKIQVVLGGKAGTLEVAVTPNIFNKLKVIKTHPQTVSAGDNITLKALTIDAHGNTVKTAPESSGFFTLNITSTLNGQDMLSTSLLNPSPDVTAGNSNTTVTGQLTNGEANVVLKSTGSGNMTFAAALKDAGGTDFTLPGGMQIENVYVFPLTTIDHIVFDPNLMPATSYTASATSPMPAFQVLLKDQFDNTINTNNETQITLSLAGSPHKTLQGFTSVKSNSGQGLFTSVKYTYPENIQIVATENTSGKTVTSATMSVNLGGASRAIVVMPGQTFNASANNLTEAVTGLPTPLVACNSYNVDVYVVDDAYNLVSSYVNNVNLSSPTDSTVTFTAKPFSGGKASFTYIPRKNGTHHLTPSSFLPNNINSSDYTTSVGTPTQFIVLLPNQTLSEGATNAANASSGSMSPALRAGDLFNIKAVLTDSCFNKVTTADSTAVGLINTSFTGSGLLPSNTDSYLSGTRNLYFEPGTKTLTSGEASFMVRYYKSITGTNISTSSSKTNNASDAFDVSNTTAHHLSITTNPTAGATYTAGSIAADATSIPLVVEIKDAFDNTANTAPDNNGLITLTRSGGAGNFYTSTCAGGCATQNIAATSGVLNLSRNLNLRDTSTNNTITLAYSSLASVVSNAFQIAPAAIASFSFTDYPGYPGVPSAVTAGSAFTVTITAKDAYGNVKTDYNGAIRLTSNDPQILTIIPSYTFQTGAGKDNGIKTFSDTSGLVLFKTAATGTRNLTVSTSPGGTLPTTISNFTVNATSASKLSTTTSYTAKAGECKPIVVNIVDAYGNQQNVSVPTTITFQVTGTTDGDLYTAGCTTTLSGISQNRSYLLNNGNSYTAYFKSTRKETATLTLGGTLAGMTSSISVTPNTDNLIFEKISGDGQTNTVDTTLTSSLVVKIRDNYNNGVIGANVTFAIASGGGNLGNTSAITAADGTASTTWKLGTIAGAQSVQATAPAGVTPAALIFSASATAGNPNKIIFATQPVSNQIRGQNFVTSPAVQVQDYFGNNVPNSGTTITLTPQLNNCANNATGTLSTSTATTNIGGLAIFPAMNYQYTPVSDGQAETLYLKADISGIITTCSHATTVYDILKVNPTTATLNTSGTQTLTATGGVPPLKFTLITNGSQSTTTGCTSCTNIGNNTYQYGYIAGSMGGNASDTIRIEDSFSTPHNTNVSITVNGAKLQWHNIYNPSTSTASDISSLASDLYLENVDTTYDSSPVTIVLENCKRNGVPESCGNAWSMNTICDAAPIAKSDKCTPSLTFRGSNVTTGSYTVDLNATATNGGNVKTTVIGLRN